MQLVDKDPDRAIALFWAAINAGDRVDSALKDMAIVMKQQNRPEEAIEAIKSLRMRCSDQAQESLDNVLLDLYKVGTLLTLETRPSGQCACDRQKNARRQSRRRRRSSCYYCLPPLNQILRNLFTEMRKTGRSNRSAQTQVAPHQSGYGLQWQADQDCSLTWQEVSGVHRAGGYSPVGESQQLWYYTG